MQHPAVHMTAGALAGVPVPTPGMGLGYLCRHSLLSRIKVAFCACSLSNSAVLLVGALMHAPPRLVFAASRQCSRHLASLSLFTSTNLAIMGDGGPLGLAPPSSKPTVQEGGQRTHKNDFAVHQQILAAALQPAYFESDH